MSTIFSTSDIQYTIVNGKLVESSLGAGMGRNIKLATLGKILRGYKTTKQRQYESQKGIRVNYAMRGYALTVRVAVNGPNRMSIGCVGFDGNDAKTLRKAALKSSKVLA
jgi:hypothetical protein